jgi:hypothetical protein
MKSHIPGVSFEETSPKGEGSWHFVGGVVGGMQIGIHLLRFGVRPPGLCTGSNSKLRFKVTQAILIQRLSFLGKLLGYA